MNKLERKAALMVAGATAGVIISGVTLLKRHARYITKKAAATFGEDDGEDFPEEEPVAAKEAEDHGEAGAAAFQPASDEADTAAHAVSQDARADDSEPGKDV